MEARTLQAFLRVLYTVNNNPQYILAKSSSQVPVIVCCETTTRHATNEPVYARAPFKACLAAICDSSPELLQDPARDFSLYVLDPLEVQPQSTSLAHVSHHTNSPHGVAVALGLMSWALESNDSMNVSVTGTIIPNASTALEVIFALRETKRVPKPMLHSHPSFCPIPASGPSHPLNPPYPQAAWSSTSQVQQQKKTLTRSADFPELYIGPPRRGPGRPEGSISSRSRVKSKTNTTSRLGLSSLKVPESRSEPQQKIGRRSKQKSKSRSLQLPLYSPFICEPLMRNATTGTPEAGATGSRARHHPQVHPTDDPLLRLLLAFPSASSGNTAASTTPNQQTALLSALHGLLSSNPHLLQLVAASTGVSTSNGEQSAENKPAQGVNDADDDHDDADSDIVILDSSAVDTTAFRKPNHRDLAAIDDTSSLMTSQESSMACSQSTDSSPLPAGTPPSVQEASSETLTLTATPKAKTSTSKYMVSGRMEQGNRAPSHVLDVPRTPTPSRTRKRKLDEYTQDRALSSTPTPPPSPSPSMMCASSSGTALNTRQQDLASQILGIKSVPSPPGRLGSLGGIATSGSRLQALSHEHWTTLTASKVRDQSTTLVSGPSRSKIGDPGNDASLNVALGAGPLKRMRTVNMNEFMAEREARKNAKVRNRPSSGHKLEVEIFADGLQVGPSRPLKSMSTSRQARSSPPRPLFRSNQMALSLSSSTYQPGLMSGPAIGSTSAVVPRKNPFKKFVVPEWARTGTAMLPRLSEEALARQQAEREAKKAQVSLRRREAAKARRKRLRDAEHRCKESSDDDDGAVANDPKSRSLHPSSSVARSTPLLHPSLPALPVFASGGVAPIPSSPPQTHWQLAPPSTPPRKSVASGPALLRTPSKSGPCSLFTPSDQDPGSLFTPSTPSVTRSLARPTFTPRSPTVLNRSCVKSPRKSVPQMPWTPKRSSTSHQAPRSLHSGRNASFASPSLAMRTMRTPQTQTGMGTRTFLLPPPSPCISRMRTAHLQNQIRSKVEGGLSQSIFEGSGIINQESPSNEQNVNNRDKSLKEEDTPAPICEPNSEHPEVNLSNPPEQYGLALPAVEDDQEIAEVPNITSDDVALEREEYAFSPLPPSSPLPASPFSSPAKHHDSDPDTPTINNLAVPDSNILLPSAGDSDGQQGTANTAWLSDDACNPSWFTETEAWLTDTEGDPLLIDSDGAWFSDSDAVFGDMSSLPLFSASNWFSDDADVETDGEGGAMNGRDGGFDTAAFERAFAALVERGGQSMDGKDDGGSAIGTSSTGVAESDFWRSIQPLLGENAIRLDDLPTAARDAVANPVGDGEVAREFQKLLNDLASS